MTEIYSQNLFYRLLKESDVTETYVNWLNDSEINKYLETRHSYHTLDSCQIFVADMLMDKNQHLFGIFLKSNNAHIGNIKLGFIDPNHHTGQIGLLIGEKDQWGKGFATEAIKELTSWGFKSLSLQKIEAGCYDENIGSLRAFLKAGYQVEGFLRSHSVCGTKRVGSFLLGILPHEIL
jgi:ribosomal-protein-alanine N-acetyltransferase